jgi:hypothetical protein
MWIDGTYYMHAKGQVGYKSLKTKIKIKIKIDD